MRELKFRAWDGKRMTTNFYFTSKGVCSIIDSFEVYQSKDWHVMQFTGLKDKNGVKIYEGDILTYQSEHLLKDDIKYNLIVEEDKHNTGFKLKWGGRYITIQPHISDCVVIGNIHENPQLTK